MIRVVVNHESFNKFRAAVDTLPAGTRAVVVESLERWGTRATNEMKASHGEDAHAMQRYENRTFELTESIGFEAGAAEDSGGTISHPIAVFAKAEYAYDVENGVPGRSNAYPFFWKEIFSGTHRDLLQQDLQQGVNDLLASVAERS